MYKENNLKKTKIDLLRRYFSGSKWVQCTHFAQIGFIFSKFYKGLFLSPYVFATHFVFLRKFEHRKILRSH